VARLPRVGRPEPRRVRGEHLVGQHQPAVGVATELELGVGEDDPPLPCDPLGTGVDGQGELAQPGGRVVADLRRDRGIILADTKLEFGRRPDGTTILADEVLTPDSSRFWPAAQWQPGRAQPSYDKQIVRDWLTSPASGWDRSSGEAPPPLPPEVVERTRSRYIEAYELLTGRTF
jgi:phosphoribosylaminoimidazole-succinocarboxamide synthase